VALCEHPRLSFIEEGYYYKERVERPRRTLLEAALVSNYTKKESFLHEKWKLYAFF